MKAQPSRVHRAIGGVPQFTRENRDELIAIAIRGTEAVDGKSAGFWHEASRLTPRRFHILALLYVMDMSEAEAAEVLGSKQTTVNYQHRQALSVLREGIEAKK